MTRDEFIRTVAKRSGMTIRQAREAVDAVFTCAADALAAGETVKIHGFGTFGFREFKGRMYKYYAEPDKAAQLDSRKVLSFVPSEKLRDRVRDFKGGQ